MSSWKASPDILWSCLSGVPQSSCACLEGFQSINLSRLINQHFYCQSSLDVVIFWQQTTNCRPMIADRWLSTDDCRPMTADRWCRPMMPTDDQPTITDRWSPTDDCRSKTHPAIQEIKLYQIFFFFLLKDDCSVEEENISISMKHAEISSVALVTLNYSQEKVERISLNGKVFLKNSVISCVQH